MDNVNRSVKCANERCGNTIYEAAYSFDTGKAVPVWRCTNCMRETPRHTRNRPTNKSKAWKLWAELRQEWAETNTALDAFVRAGKTPSGCLLVHTSTWNHHVNKLAELERPTAFDLAYHGSEARKDLVRAKAFVAELEAKLNV